MLPPNGRRRHKFWRRTFWPGPLTLVLKKQAAVPALVTAGIGYGWRAHAGASGRAGFD
jgi:tRNA A37 threonylcarbamoyladenosine synthetase subunit TsaC/SUA5/YrdC